MRAALTASRVRCVSVLQVGMNGGHSTVAMLLANPRLVAHVFDMMGAPCPYHLLEASSPGSPLRALVPATACHVVDTRALPDSRPCQLPGALPHRVLCSTRVPSMTAERIRLPTDRYRSSPARAQAWGYSPHVATLLKLRFGRRFILHTGDSHVTIGPWARSFRGNGSVSTRGRSRDHAMRLQRSLRCSSNPADR